MPVRVLFGDLVIFFELLFTRVNRRRRAVTSAVFSVVSGGPTWFTPLPVDTVRKIRVLPSDPGTASALSVSRESGDRRVNGPCGAARPPGSLRRRFVARWP